MIQKLDKYIEKCVTCYLFFKILNKFVDISYSQARFYVAVTLGESMQNLCNRRE